MIISTHFCNQLLYPCEPTSRNTRGFAIGLEALNMGCVIGVRPSRWEKLVTFTFTAAAAADLGNKTSERICEAKKLLHKYSLYLSLLVYD